jgi:hypothetical protein
VPRQAASVSGTAARETAVAGAQIAGLGRVATGFGMLNWCAQGADAHQSVQDAAYGLPPYGRAEDTPMRYTRTLDSGAF